jgi:methanogenic corrinoid protein MtbC1
MPGVAPDTIIELIEARRRDAVADLVLELREADGVDAVIDLLAAVQAEVGSRWHTQRWTVADEHAASAIVDHALSVVGAAAPTMPGEGRIVVACVEDEWHVLPARMLAEQLRARGWDPIFLGASSPADQLGRFARRSEPVAVALSCSLAVHLPGARRSIEACHDAGLPVVAGGSALPGAERARAIGADAWGASADEVVEVLGAWAVEGPPPLATPTVPTPERLAVTDRARILDEAVAVLTRRVAPLADAPAHVRARLRDDLEGLLRAAEAAAHVADPSIVAEQVRWLRALSEARGEPGGLTAVALEALAGAAPAALRGELAVEL